MRARTAPRSTAFSSSLPTSRTDAGIPPSSESTAAPSASSRTPSTRNGTGSPLNGYVVIAANPRGSSGRGEKFQTAIYADWGRRDTEDVLAAVDDAVKRGIADPDRLAVGGWSYGGMLTNYVIASTTRFRAAASGAGISNIFTGYGTDQYVREYEQELGPPWKNRDAWLKVSYPFFHADRIRTPTLFLCGESDFNVPLLNSEQMYQALRSQGVPTQLVIYYWPAPRNREADLRARPLGVTRLVTTYNGTEKAPNPGLRGDPRRPWLVPPSGRAGRPRGQGLFAWRAFRDWRVAAAARLRRSRQHCRPAALRRVRPGRGRPMKKGSSPIRRWYASDLVFRGVQYLPTRGSWA